MKGKPTFPCEVSVNKERTEYQIKQVGNDSFLEHGMTLRDYFAAKAMQGYIMRWSIDKKFEFGDPESVSKMSYEFADAMIEESQK